MKYKAYQVAPEYQESPLFSSDEFFPDNIAVCGNRDYIEHCPEVFERVYNVLSVGELAEVLENRNEWKQWYKNITEAIVEYLPPEMPGKVKYSTQDIGALKKLVLKYAWCKSHEEHPILCAILTVVTGQKWNCKIIHGYGQSDWNYIYYPSDEWTVKELKYFEAEYFNEGTEWSIQDESGEEVYIYVHEYGQEKNEISKALGINTADIVLYWFDGWTKTEKYRMED